MKLMIDKTKILIVCSWLAAYLILFYYVKSCSYDTHININLVVSAIEIVCLITCSIFLKRILIPKFLYQKKIIKFFLLLLLLIIFFAVLMQILQSVWYSITNTQLASQALYKHYYYQLYSCWWITLCGCLCIIAFKVIRDQWLTVNRYNQLERENAQTELRFLKAQINPHFLFNSINSIFASIDKTNTLARETVLKFSDMLRYQLYECNVDQISFEKEFTYLNNYVELQRLRKEENLIITIDTKGNMGGFTIAPLLLIPFIENAFKYSSNHSDQKNILQLIFSNLNGEFSFYCINTKDRIQSRKLFEEGGIGIKNVQRRLELMYPNRHELTINDNDLSFEINLKIML